MEKVIEFDYPSVMRELAKQRRQAIRDAERFLAHTRVPFHLVRSVRQTIAKHRAAIAETERKFPCS